MPPDQPLPPGFASAPEPPDTPEPGQSKPPRRRGKGLECPRCGCRHFLTPDTVPVAGAVRRYRYCRNCHLRVITREVIEER